MCHVSERDRGQNEFVAIGKRDDGQKSQDDEEGSSSLYNTRNTFRLRQR